ncbi:MAG: hypothetical protein QMD25_00110 [Caldisericia bacterium]|jgi:hypothetical protein|nr:hypothetical protein [Caldisericia bacterium]
MKKFLIFVLIVLVLITFVRFKVFADPSDTGGSPLKQSTPIELVQE